MPSETKDLEFIQAIIARMAGNSFQLKAWQVALATAAIGYAASKTDHSSAALLAMIPSLAFWSLDAYYLALEKLFRDVFKASAKLTAPTFNLNPGAVKPALWWECFCRPAVAGLHGPLLVTICLVMYWRP